MKASVRINRGLESLFGTRDENIRLIESGLCVHTQLVDNSLEIEGDADNVNRVENILEDYNTLVREGHIFNNGDLNSYLRVVTVDRDVSLRALVRSGKQRISGRRCWRRSRSTSAGISRRLNATIWFSGLALRAPAKPIWR